MMFNSSIDKSNTGFQLSSQHRQAFDDLFAQSSQIGCTAEGGLNRQTATPADAQMRDVFCQWLTQHGFTVKIDAIGNIFGCIEFDSDLDYVLCGSHLDTQPNGGQYDGIYGVLAGAVAIHGIAQHIKQQALKPQFNLAVVSWCNEEGARFQPSLIGSSVFVGQLALETALASQDAKGINLATALSDIGYLGQDQIDFNIAYYYELHIEQGGVLEHAKKTIGIVDATWAALKLKIRFFGEQNHTGPTPMMLRKDALLAAARCIALVRDFVEHPLPQLTTAQVPLLHSSVGRIDCAPNSPNIVANQVDIYVEFRSTDEQYLLEIADALCAELSQIDQQCQSTHQIISSELRQSAQLDSTLCQENIGIAEQLDYDYLLMKSIAGHDAIRLSASIDSSLIFVPSRQGLSHNAQEYTDPADLHAGLNFLSHVLSRKISQSPV